MDEWHPIPPVDDSFYDEKSYEDLPILLRSSNTMLIEAVESRFRLASHGEINDDVANWIEIWLRKKIRAFSGGDMSEFANTNPYLQSIGGRTGFHLQNINYVVCSNSSIRIYLENSINLSLIEQSLRINVLLSFSRELTKLHFGKRGATLEIAVLMCKLGLDKFCICNHSK